MEKILNSILDIDPNDPTVLDMERLATQYGLLDMADAVREAVGLYGLHGQKIGFALDLRSCKAVVRTFLAAAILNYASSIHPEFFVNLPEQPDEMPRIYQTMSANDHREYADKYLKQAKDLVSQFEN